ncbi:MAG TPA: dienelactone hydrolase family protein [Candidatus Krumholzibacteria bacterium]|nr:dienelactone hydrolase family protein [Candidatus Krumholzibacteria bacterium]
MSPPHDDQPVLWAGAALETARAGAIFVHGRGADARDILGLAAEVDPGDIAFAAPDAAGHTWYPYSFLAPMEQNEPGISSGLGVLGELVKHFEAAGIPPEKLLLLGFSQGACLALEYAARHAQRYGGVAGLSGGLIGPPGTPRDYAGAFDGTPVFLGCSDMDPHIPKERVVETSQVMERMGAGVTMRLYARMGHTVNMDELALVREMLAAL